MLSFISVLLRKTTTNTHKHYLFGLCHLLNKVQPLLQLSFLLSRESWLSPAKSQTQIYLWSFIYDGDISWVTGRAIQCLHEIAEGTIQLVYPHVAVQTKWHLHRDTWRSLKYNSNRTTWKRIAQWWAAGRRRWPWRRSSKAAALETSIQIYELQEPEGSKRDKAWPLQNGELGKQEDNYSSYTEDTNQIKGEGVDALATQSHLQKLLGQSAQQEHGQKSHGDAEAQQC